MGLHGGDFAKGVRLVMRDYIGIECMNGAPLMARCTCNGERAAVRPVKELELWRSRAHARGRVC